MKRLAIAAAFIATVSFSSRAASASTVTFDQTNPFYCPNLTSGSPGNPNLCASTNPYARGLVQTFTPSLTALDYAEVWVADVHDDALNQGSVTQLQIRAGGVGGAILGTAQTAVGNHGYSPGSVFSISFTFSSPVALTPGGLYAWQFIVVSGDTEGLALFQTWNNVYNGGTGYSGGSDSGGDWFFVEGLQTQATAVPEPVTSSLVAMGLAASLLRRARRRSA